MHIYVVQKGDSLWQLSQRYGVPASRIGAVNGLADNNVLVIGQALVIPVPENGGNSLTRKETGVHTVQKGETMHAVAKQYGLSLQQLMQANSIGNPALAAAGASVIIPEAAKPEIEVNGYVKPGSNGVRDAKQYASSLTYLSPFSYSVSADGSLVPLDDEALIQAAIAGGAAPMLVVSNFEGDNFSPDLAHALLQNAGAREKLTANILQLMQDKSYIAVNVDFEYVPVADKNMYHQLLQRLVDTLHPHGYLVSAALAPKTSSDQAGLLYEGHDYAAQGAIVDFVILMTYEWGWFGGSPMAVAPLNEVNKVVRYAVSVIPPDKILMGMPLYGYDWTLPYKPGTTAETVSPQEAVERAATMHANIEYDEQAESPFYHYYDSAKTEHVVWFEDARSVQAKYNLVKSYGLRGVSYWVLGVPFVPNWYVLKDNFTIRQLPFPSASSGAN
ncbi:glycoside hydrolase family 18 protein [Paenibacillus protaetiae]|uniref:LysM peptidoglycan-binding domain-containing protein n=1 Tax=Paenibacillus protaetiae TaxID=2509456 RepID=A0A4P6EUV8_9BACL|nr:glycosyl hydrolase family 18 protein [Paenibacillus protaetiae]QAY67050.1 LysM peptidoglycan-binding domain-containing protein [Paenibacillus protaetiae]